MQLPVLLGATLAVWCAAIASRLIERAPERIARAMVRNLEAALKTIGADIENKAALIKALRALPAVQRYGMGTLVYSPLSGGWLTGRWRKGAPGTPTSAARPGARFDMSTAANQRKLDVVEELALLTTMALQLDVADSRALIRRDRDIGGVTPAVLARAHAGSAVAAGA